MASVLGNTIEFFTRFGMFDVVLPFLLVFTIVFAILEKNLLNTGLNNKSWSLLKG